MCVLDMIKVSKEEAETIRKLRPDITISGTMKNTSRRKNFVPEYLEIIEWLKKERGVDTID